MTNGGVLVLALLALNCGGDSSANAKKDALPDLIKYESLPAKHYLTDNKGAETHMWATLHTVNPPRGSSIDSAAYAKRLFTEIVGTCPGECFEFRLDVGLDDDGSQVPGMAWFDAGLSKDGGTIFQNIATIAAGGGVPTTVSLDPNVTLIRFKDVPSSFVITGRYDKDAKPEGSTSFVLGYKDVSR